MQTDLKRTTSRPGFRSRTTAALLAAFALTTMSLGHATAQESGRLVTIDSGSLEGIATDKAEQFLGIPYAAPPIKNLRFSPPQPAIGWTGTVAADDLPPACLQFEPHGALEGQAASEDCLYLSLYRPLGTTASDARPVMVYFHGGAWTQGTSANYGGASLVAETGVIEISINYRLGALGYLAHTGLSAETPMGSGNYGTMDQIAALEWVKRNVAAFGGDPDNVTIFGQSAGAGSVCALLAAPSAAGLFHRAILHSLPCGWVSTDLKMAEPSGVALAEAVGCPAGADQVACLRGVWAGTLIAHQADYTGGIKVGGGLIPVAPEAAIASGEWNQVPMMVGATRSEFKLVAMLLMPELYGVTAETYPDMVRKVYPDRADEVLELYPLANFNSPYEAITQAMGDEAFVCGTGATVANLAKWVPTYQYEFDDRTSPGLYGFDSPPGADMSNGHSADLQYLVDYDLGAADLDATQEKLATQMMNYWASFAANGNPNFEGAPVWPQWANNQQVLSLGAGGESTPITSFAAEHNCNFWSSSRN